MNLDASVFDGHRSRRQPVRLSAGQGCLLIEGADGAQQRIPVADIRVSEPQGSAPRTLRFAGSEAFCEVGQGPAFDALLAALGCRESVVVRLQRRWRWVFVSLALFILGTAAGYLWGLPWGARLLAPHVPVSAMGPVSDEAMEFLDKNWFQPSRLSEERRQKLQDGFRALAAADPLLAAYGDKLALNFRASPKIGPNALTLPDGQVVLLDELVNLEMNDEEILAVLCHELGHLNKRHSIRLLIQSSAVGLVTAALFGDVSYIAATAGAVLLSSSYSRDMEIEADDYAADMLRAQGKSPARLAAALEKLDAFHRAAAHKDDEDDKDKEFSDWFSSHPASTERIRRLRED